MEQSRYNLQGSSSIEKTDSNEVKFNYSIPQQFLPDSTKKGDKVVVHVGSVLNPTQFWVILKKGFLDVADLMYYIQEVYFDKTQSQELKISEEDVSVNMFCVTLYEGEFNRAVVRKVYKKRNLVEILFIDYGTVSLIDSRKLYYLLDKFSYLPQQAIKTKLAGIRPSKTKWSNEAIEEFSSMVGEFKKLTAKIVKIDRKNKILKVMLMDEQSGESVGDALVRRKFALEESSSGKSSNHLERYKSQMECQDPLGVIEKSENANLLNTVKLIMDIPTQFESSKFSEKDEILLRVSNLLNPSKFWTTLNNFYDDLQKLTMDLQETFGGRTSQKRIPFNELTEGLPCVVLIGLKYCRAFITRVRMDEGKVNVFCFDYGNFCSVDQTELFYMYERFADLPQQAIRTSLIGIVPRDPCTGWSRKAVDRFAEMVNQKTLRAKISSVDNEKHVLKVLMTDDCSTANRICISTALVQEQWASISL